MLILTLLGDYYTEKIFDDNYKFDEKGVFYAPPTGELKDYVSFIETLPNVPSPDVYGFHANADITKNMNEANVMFDAMLLTQSSGGGEGGGMSFEGVVTKIAEGILSDPPELIDDETAQRKFPPSYGESMNTVFTQEVMRFNNLCKALRNSLDGVLKALTGQSTMSATIEATMKNLFDGKVPKMWMDVSYPSLKPLGSYIADLKARIDFFKKWLNEGQPNSYNISRFFFTQSFLTGALQNFARKYTIPIDLIKFNFEVVKGEEFDKPEDGVIVLSLIHI